MTMNHDIPQYTTTYHYEPWLYPLIPWFFENVAGLRKPRPGRTRIQNHAGWEFAAHKNGWIKGGTNRYYSRWLSCVLLCFAVFWNVFYFHDLLAPKLWTKWQKTSCWSLKGFLCCLFLVFFHFLQRRVNSWMNQILIPLRVKIGPGPKRTQGPTWKLANLPTWQLIHGTSARSRVFQDINQVQIGEEPRGTDGHWFSETKTHSCGGLVAWAWMDTHRSDWMVHFWSAWRFQMLICWRIKQSHSPFSFLRWGRKEADPSSFWPVEIGMMQ